MFALTEKENPKQKPGGDVRAWWPRLPFRLASEPFHFADWTCGLMSDSSSWATAPIDLGAAFWVRRPLPLAPRHFGPGSPCENLMFGNPDVDREDVY